MRVGESFFGESGPLMSDCCCKENKGNTSAQAMERYVQRKTSLPFSQESSFDHSFQLPSSFLASLPIRDASVASTTPSSSLPPRLCVARQSFHRFVEAVLRRERGMAIDRKIGKGSKMMRNDAVGLSLVTKKLQVVKVDSLAPPLPPPLLLLLRSSSNRSAFFVVSETVMRWSLKLLADRRPLHPRRSPNRSSFERSTYPSFRSLPSSPSSFLLKVVRLDQQWRSKVVKWPCSCLHRKVVLLCENRKCLGNRAPKLSNRFFRTVRSSPRQSEYRRVGD